MGAGLYLGLISGTSADGIDAALARFEPQLQMLAARTFPYPPELRASILDVSQHTAALSFEAYAALDAQIGDCLAEATLELLRIAGVQAASVRAVGSHGQTLWHRPRPPHPYTLQLGDPNRIAERTGICTVADFRRRDVAAGGQGAPLLPAFHAAALHCSTEDRVVLNLGGIANVTVMPAGAAPSGFDTGPANALMDAWSMHTRAEPFDAGGAVAASGNVHEGLLARLLAEPFFDQRPPKSTGRDLFQLGWLELHLQEFQLSDADVQATLVELSARSASDAIARALPASTRVLLCGGGVRNPLLVARLTALLAPRTVQSTAELGIDPDFMEALGFAWLARQTMNGAPGNLPAVTGARGPRVLGAIYPC